MNCRELGRWLDDGGAPGRYLEAMAHARICAHCSAALGALDELESLLGAPAAPAPAGFAARVMARVAETRQAGARVPVMELLPFFPSVPWWVRIALEPASLLAMLLASVMMWRGDALYALASGGAVHLAAWLAGASMPSVPMPALVLDPGPATAIWLQPTVVTALALGALPMAWMGSRVLYRWTAALSGPRHPRPRWAPAALRVGPPVLSSRGLGSPRRSGQPCHRAAPQPAQSRRS